MGYKYVEQTLDPKYRALVTGVRFTRDPVQNMLLSKADAQIAVMPDEIGINVPDKLIMIDRRVVARETLIKNTRDTLTLKPAYRVITIRDDNGVEYLEHVNWELLNHETIQWIHTPEPAEYYSVEYEYHPTFWFLGTLTVSPRPTDVEPGVLLPLRGGLSYKHPSQVEVVETT
jgi:hypothetical protein